MQILEKPNLSVRRETKGKLPGLPFSRLHQAILGQQYELGIVFVDEPTSKKFNKNYRGINKPTNILSFSLTKNSGEIIINLRRVRLEAKNFERSYLQFLLLLVIHGMLHLEGFEHSSKMEEKEEKFYNKFINSIK